jgi:hypothetical protein
MSPFCFFCLMNTYDDDDDSCGPHRSFFPDEISPSQAGQDSGADYEILSKRVAAAAASKPTNTP